MKLKSPHFTLNWSGFLFLLFTICFYFPSCKNVSFPISKIEFIKESNIKSDTISDYKFLLLINNKFNTWMEIGQNDTIEYVPFSYVKNNDSIYIKHINESNSDSITKLIYIINKEQEVKFPPQEIGLEINARLCSASKFINMESIRIMKGYKKIECYHFVKIFPLTNLIYSYEHIYFERSYMTPLLIYTEYIDVSKNKKLKRKTKLKIDYFE